MNTIRAISKIGINLFILCLLLSCVSTSEPGFRVSEITVEPLYTTTETSETISILSPDISPTPTQHLMEVPVGDVFLDQVAQDTWQYLSSDWATSNHLPWSWRSVNSTQGDFANPAEIGLYILSWVAAYDLQRPWSPTWTTTEMEVEAVLDQLRAWQTGSQASQPHGSNAYGDSVFYQWYWISWDPPVVGANTGLNHLVPSIDNAWLAASLITIREYTEANGYLILAGKADDILHDMDFTLWYDTDSHLFTWGAVEDPYGGSLADYYSNENRIINFIARALGDLDNDEFLLSLETLEQPSANYNGITVEKVAWDGSYFTYATPALFIREIDTSFGQNTILSATQAQIAYAQAQGYDAWGLSDCFDIGLGDYVQQGAPPVAMPDAPETRPGLVTPHASGLALITPLESDVSAHLQVLSTTFPAFYDPTYGFHDAVMTKPTAPDYGQFSDRFTALGQEWLFLAIVNQQSGFIWEYFYRDSGVLATHQEMFEKTQIFLPVVLNIQP